MKQKVTQYKKKHDNSLVNKDMNLKIDTLFMDGKID